MGRPHWRTRARIRRAALERAGWRCERCGAAGRLEVHHRVEVQHGGTDAPDNLEVLCVSCHIAHHRRERIGPERAAWLARPRGSGVELGKQRLPALFDGR